MHQALALEQEMIGLSWDKPGYRQTMLIGKVPDLISMKKKRP
ncbi:hypothetical protein [Taibaiella helva]|nr:hypothetical protein [Taibaiella helva]